MIYSMGCKILHNPHHDPAYLIKLAKCKSKIDSNSELWPYFLMLDNIGYGLKQTTDLVEISYWQIDKWLPQGEAMMHNIMGAFVLTRLKHHVV